jgi:hypothetical protein
MMALIPIMGMVVSRRVLPPALLWCRGNHHVLLPLLPAALLANSLWTAIHAGYDQLPQPLLNVIFP